MTPPAKISDEYSKDDLQSRLDPLPFDFPDPPLLQLITYINLFHKWNLEYKFSRAKTPDEIVSSLIIPSLLLGLLVDPKAIAVDLGTGPGIPGIPLRILYPDLRLTLIESSTKSTEFLGLVRNELDLANLEIVDGRAEVLAHNPDMHGQFNLALARSFAPLPVVAEIASGFLKPGGCLLVQCSKETSSELPGSVEPGIVFDRLGAILQGSPDPMAQYFIRFRQMSATPSDFPRSWKKMKNRPIW